MRIEVACPSSWELGLGFFPTVFCIAAALKPLVGRLLCRRDWILLPSLCVSFFQNAANGLLLSNKEEFAMAPVEIGYPSILLANTIAKMTAIRGMYLHLFAKAKHFARRIPVVCLFPALRGESICGNSYSTGASGRDFVRRGRRTR